MLSPDDARLLERLHGDLPLTERPFADVASLLNVFLLVFGMLLSASNLGAWGVLYAVTPEIYPTRLRGAAAGAAAVEIRERAHCGKWSTRP